MKTINTDHASEKRAKAAMSEVCPKLVYSNSDTPALTFIVEPNVSDGNVLSFVDRYFDTDVGVRILTVVGPQGNALPNRPTTERRVVAPVDFQLHIARGTRVVAVGKALRYVTGTSAVTYDAFQDYILDRTSFFSPQLGAFVYPIPPFDQLTADARLDQDFADRQIRKAYHAEHKPLRRARLTTEVLTNVDEFFAEHAASDEVALDIETRGLNWHVDDILGVSFAFDGHTGYYLPWEDIDVGVLSGFLANKRLILANGKFDLKFLRRAGLRVPPIAFDTMHAGHTINELRRNNLKTHAWIYTSHGGYDADLEKFFVSQGGKKRDYGLVPEDVLAKYAATDAAVTYQVAQAQKRELEELDDNLRAKGYDKTPRDYFFETVMPAVNLFADIEMQGVPVERQKLGDLLRYANAERERLKKRFFQVASENLRVDTGGSCEYPLDPKTHNINIDSPQQLGLLLEHTLEWEPISRSKTEPKDREGNRFRKLRAPGWFAIPHMRNFPPPYRTDKDSLRIWHSDYGHEEADILLQYRKMAQIEKLYGSGNGKGEKFSDLVQSDSCVYPTYLPMYTETGRTKCIEPNLQNQTTHTKEAKRIRAIFDAPSADHVIVELDYSNFQLRIAAGVSNDVLMGQVFKSGTGDLHATTARTIFYPAADDAEIEELRDTPRFKKARSQAKAVNFGLIFGRSAKSLAGDLKDTWPLAEAEEFVKEKDLGDLRRNLESKLAGKGGSARLTDDDRAFAIYWATAWKIRKEFFVRYAGLYRWLQRTTEEAHRNGFVVSPLGAMRRLPELRFYPYQRGNMPRRVSGQYNEAVNFPIQNAEAVVIHQGMVRLREHLQKLGLEFRVMTMVHDSLVLYVHRDELDQVVTAAAEVLEQPYEELNDIPFAIEAKLADPRAGTPWGFGWDRSKDELQMLSTGEDIAMQERDSRTNVSKCVGNAPSSTPTTHVGDTGSTSGRDPRYAVRQAIENHDSNALRESMNGVNWLRLRIHDEEMCCSDYRPGSYDSVEWAAGNDAGSTWSHSEDFAVIEDNLELALQALRTGDDTAISLLLERIFPRERVFLFKEYANDQRDRAKSPTDSVSVAKHFFSYIHTSVSIGAEWDEWGNDVLGYALLERDMWMLRLLYLVNPSLGNLGSDELLFTGPPEWTSPQTAIDMARELGERWVIDWIHPNRVA